MAQARTLRRCPLLWCLLALCILAGQAPARALQADKAAEQLRSLDRAMVLCQPGHRRDTPRPAMPHTVLCEASLVEARGQIVLAILQSPLSLPAPPAYVRQRAVTLPPARAPPARASELAYPRGPPGTA